LASSKGLASIILTLRVGLSASEAAKAAKINQQQKDNREKALEEAKKKVTAPQDGQEAKDKKG